MIKDNVNIISDMQNIMDERSFRDWRVASAKGYEDCYAFYSDYWGDHPEIIMDVEGSIKCIENLEEGINFHDIKGIYECSSYLNRIYYLTDTFDD